MKQIFVVLVCLPLLATAQKNIVKINASSLALKNFSFQYEREVGLKSTLSLGIRFMPKSGLPFQSTAEDVFNFDDDVNVGRFKTGNFAITPEYRFYLGRKNMRGFYIAPYARYATFNITLPVKYSSGGTRRDADFTGNIQSFSGGVMAGTQYTFGGKFVLDIWILGGHCGASNGNLNSVTSPPLTATEQSSLRETLEDFDPSPFKYSYSVNANGAQIKANGPWAGIRGAGINLGIRF